MAMAHGRKITIGDRTYEYVIRGGEHPLRGWSGKTIRVIVQLEPRKFARHTFASKAWTTEHEENPDIAPAHKAAFTPEDVRQVIAAIESGKGQLPSPFELPDWKLVS